MRDFIKNILIEDFGANKCLTVFENSELLQYLDKKTEAVNRDSKARRAFGNIYAIYSILHFYVEDNFYSNPTKYKEFGGYEFGKLLDFCHTLYGGEKIQNHALNNRLNFEFENRKKIIENNKNKPLIVIKDSKYLVHVDYLYVDNNDISKTVIKIIETYISLLKEKDTLLIEQLTKLENENNLQLIRDELSTLLNEDSEARVFEMFSYAILKNYYQSQKVYFGFRKGKIKKEPLKLYKTGRTNANDGGIDFVMKPLGRFFQVTEIGTYDKYFLDIDKVERYPITFVIKTKKTKKEVKKELAEYFEQKSGGVKAIAKKYKAAVEDVITMNELEKMYKRLNASNIKGLLRDILNCYKIEMYADAENEALETTAEQD